MVNPLIINLSRCLEENSVSFLSVVNRLHGFADSLQIVEGEGLCIEVLFNSSLFSNCEVRHA